MAGRVKMAPATTAPEQAPMLWMMSNSFGALKFVKSESAFYSVAGNCFKQSPVTCTEHYFLSITS